MNHWTIVGAGAIGGLIAHQLNQHGIPVQIVERSPSQQVTKSISVIHQGISTDVEFPLYRQDAPIQQIILATKSYQTEDAITPLSNAIAPNAIIIVLQNGMGSADWLQTRFPSATVLGATTTHGAYRQDKDTIVHAGQGSTWIGPFSPTQQSAAKAIYDHWHQAGVPIEWDGNIEQRLWIKLAINCAINPLTALYNCKNGEILQNLSARLEMEKVIAEFETVYIKKFGDPAPINILDIVIDVANKTAQNISSMHQDVINHRRTEIEAINGYLIQQGETLGIECENNRALLKKIEALDS